MEKRLNKGQWVSGAARAAPETQRRENFEKNFFGKKLRQPGVEPGAKAWEASMLPIHHWRYA